MRNLLPLPASLQSHVERGLLGGVRFHVKITSVVLFPPPTYRAPGDERWYREARCELSREGE